MKWCNPCALVWVVILSAFASHLWLNIDMTYCITAVIVLLPMIAAYVIREREDIYFTLQGIVNEVWWMLTHLRKPKYKSTHVLKDEVK